MSGKFIIIPRDFPTPQGLALCDVPRSMELGISEITFIYVTGDQEKKRTETYPDMEIDTGIISGRIYTIHSRVPISTDHRVWEPVIANGLNRGSRLNREFIRTFLERHPQPTEAT